MLILVGLGLNDEKDITLRGIEAAKGADKVYIELYTNIWHGKERLEEIIGKKIEKLERDDLEQNSEKIITESKTKNVVILIPGDPLIATTHCMLLDDAIKNGIESSIVHNASIASAIGETGLHIYKFGASATVPFLEKTGGELPESVYDVIKMNKSRGLHTLLLLDITPGHAMTANEAMEILLEVEEKRKENVFTGDTDAVVFARAGNDDSQITFGKVAEMKNNDFGKPPMVLIVPGILHFTEKEYLENHRKSQKI